MKKITYCLLIALLTISGIDVASAYQIPAEHSVHNDIELWLCAEEHLIRPAQSDQAQPHWAKDIMDQLAINYANNGRWDSMRLKMAHLVKGTNYVIPQFVADMANARN